MHIQGILYDTSAFKHPGGKVLNQFLGKDATDIFLAIHPPHSRAMQTLRMLPQTRVSNYTKSPYHLLYEQVRELTKRPYNYEQHVNMWIFRDIVILLILHLSWVCLLRHFWLSCCIYAIAMVHSGLVMHNAIHDQFGPCRKCIVEILTGMSPEWWKQKHNILHHAHTNVAEFDTDIQSNIFSFEDKKIEWFMRYQHLYFWPLLAFLRILWCVQSARHTHFVWIHHFIILSIIQFSGDAFYWYLYGNLISGFILGFIVVQSHNGETVMHENNDDILTQTALTTRNLPFGHINNLCTGFLNYQIEHHLFPWLPSNLLPSIQPLVKATIISQGLPYTQLSWIDSTLKLHRHLRKIANSSDVKI